MPSAFQAFVKEMHQDPKLKAEKIKELQSLGFRAFAEKHYDLITRQKKELDTIKDKDSEELVTNAIVTALRRNWPLGLIHEGHNPPNMMMELIFGAGRHTDPLLTAPNQSIAAGRPT
jgi:hypothetical protein